MLTTEGIILSGGPYSVYEKGTEGFLTGLKVSDILKMHHMWIGPSSPI